MDIPLEHVVAAALTLLLAGSTSVHVVMHKRDHRVAVLWLGFIWILPLVGSMLYFLLGINRIRRKAVLLRGDLEHFASEPAVCRPWDPFRGSLGLDAGSWAPFAASIGKVTSRPLLPGNRVAPLVNGDEAFPAMLEAIQGAEHSISLVTYIFDSCSVGRRFVRALEEAVKRGLAVRVLVDSTGALYSWPTVFPRLRAAGVPHARFHPQAAIRRPLTLNLHNHRKLLVIDGKKGFTGGMNIRQGHVVGRNPPHPVQDLHFMIEGPVVAHLQEAFVDDWCYSTGERLRGDRWFPALEPRGDVLARGITDGPDEDLDKLNLTLLGALNAARKKVMVVTPYFLPDFSVHAALNLAALRGVEVQILIPQKNNLPFMHWAMMGTLLPIIEFGCAVYLTPPPFDHSKLMLVDSEWSLIGSANWDSRSLRLNFEFNVECYDPGLTRVLERHVRRKLETACPLTPAKLRQRSRVSQLRDGAVRLLSPFL